MSKQIGNEREDAAASDNTSPCRLGARRFISEAVAASRARVERYQESVLSLWLAPVASAGLERIVPRKRSPVLLLVLKDPGRWDHL